MVFKIFILDYFLQFISLHFDSKNIVPERANRKKPIPIGDPQPMIVNSESIIF
jgi:hypothetical protein